MELTLNASRSAILDYLQDKGWMEPYEEVLRLEKPGEGNMNVVVRVVGDSRRLILKQAKPFVNKYPQIPAPVDRAEVEKKFYTLTAPFPGIKKFLPALTGYDAANHILVLEDLGTGADYTFVYRKGERLAFDELQSAVGFLSELHGAGFGAEAIAAFPDNLALRQLNHEHLFVYPYMEENGFDLDSVQPGLQDAAMTYKTDSRLKSRVQELGQIYLSAGKTLLHGDYYPGSWLKVSGGFRVIDPEFCFFGPAEYDMGVMLAHLRMAQQPESDIAQVLPLYGNRRLDEGLVYRFEAMEILRRIIGLAQLPLDLSLEEKQSLLQRAASYLLSSH